MDTHVEPETPPALERLAAQLQADCGTGATLSLIPEGYSHARSQQTFSILLLSKTQVLTSLINLAPGLQILKLQAKRSGALGRTTISLKVENASAHAQTRLS